MPDSKASVAGLAGLREYRAGLYACFRRSRDALFELGEALLVAWWVQTFVGLSQAPVFRRRWPSLYAALRDGQVDRAALQRLWVQQVPGSADGDFLLVALDSTPYPRPAARTAADRTLVHVAAEGLALPRGVAPVKPGWQFSVVAQVPDTASSATFILANERIPSSQTPVEAGLAQLARLSAICAEERPERTIRCLLDAGYATATWVAGLAAQAAAVQRARVQAAAADSAPRPLAACLPYACLVRAPANRVLYRAAPLATGKRGRPRRHGDRFQGKDPATHGTPDATWSGTVADGTARTVRCWTGLHLRAVPQLGITVVCLTRAGAAGTTRDPKDTWFWWIGDPLPPLADLATLYDRRFRIEIRQPYYPYMSERQCVA